MLIIVLTALCVFLAVYIIMLKREIFRIKKELILNRDAKYNKQITISLFDRHLSDMTVEINKSLDYQKALKTESAAAEKNLRQSISDIAHDIRTPLTVIKGNLQLLDAERANMSENAAKSLDICGAKADELRYMADDFFELAVLESDIGETVLKCIDITAVLLQFIADNEAVISSNGFTPEIDFPEKSIFIMADEYMLIRIFGNLLNNIFRYSEKNFRISISEQAENCVILFENDIGTGNYFDEKSIFQRTYQGSRKNGKGGAGLGLYIVKMLAGKQNAKAEAVKQGNILSIRIIFAKADNSAGSTK